MSTTRRIPHLDRFGAGSIMRQIVLGVSCTAAAIVPSTLPSAAQEANNSLTMKERALAEGRTDYILYCQACHGSDGKGGPMGRILVKTPLDLSGLRAANGGVFPFWRVFAAVAGDTPVAGHETFQMPEFWRRFQREEALPGYAPAPLRILALSHYVESLQAK